MWRFDPNAAPQQGQQQYASYAPQFNNNLNNGYPTPTSAGFPPHPASGNWQDPGRPVQYGQYDAVHGGGGGGGGGGYGAPPGPRRCSLVGTEPPGPPPMQPGGYGAPPGPPPPQMQQGGPAAGLPYYLGTPVPPPSAQLPPRTPYYDPSQDLAELLDATQGFGTKESKLIKTLVPRTAEEIALLGYAYRGRKGRGIEGMLDGEVSGWFGMGIQALVQGPVGWDAALVREACKGPGTDELMLSELLLGRTPGEMQMLKDAFYYRYQQPMEQVVLGDLSMKTKRMFDIAFSGRMEMWSPDDQARIGQDTVALTQALKKGRTDELAVCAILLGRTQPYLHTLCESFRRASKGSLTKSIKSNFSGHMESALLFVVEGGKKDGCGAWRDAKRLEAAMKGMGTKDYQLIVRIVRMHWNRSHCQAVQAAYRKKYKKELMVRVRGETSGDYRDLLCALLGSG